MKRAPRASFAAATTDRHQASCHMRVRCGSRLRQSSLLPRPATGTTVATCGTTVVVRDSTVTLWA
ncbi:hypothetical protein CUJ89_20960 [Burkholderia pyrrocinia]|uniref:Uncharacterized protein n=1 Tax=Burkholderia pyrrocinia TaxID=60550 RepID=A0A2Z5N078_BURPY|nr:hypothetical protein CUJ89_20960 [Burkholderia pyrrocinia]